MPRAARLSDEDQRLSALRSVDLLDTPPEPEFDKLTQLAAEACKAPVALICLVDSERQWFKSKVGLCLTETPRDQAFCAHAILEDGPLIIADATLDERTRDNPLVTGEPHIRFYVGIVLHDANGFALGTLCVIDYSVRQVTSEQLDTLKRLALQAEAQIELRRRAAATGRMRATVEGTRYGIRGAVLGTLLVGLLVSAFLYVNTRRATLREAEQRFERLNAHVVDDISRRIALPSYGMKGARGVYAASKSVERSEFAAYVASRDLPREFPGVVGMGFIEHVKRSDLDRFVKAEQADGAPTFSVFPFDEQAPQLDDLWVIKHVFPEKANKAVWGLDIGSEPLRRVAAERAAESGEATITAPITLFQDKRRLRAFLYFVPVYRNGSATTTPQERMAALTGLVYTPIIVNEALAGVSDACDQMLDFSVFDGPSLSISSQLSTVGDGEHGKNAGARTFSKTSIINVGGRNWTIATTTTPKFENQIDQSASVILGVCGVLLSLLLSAVVWSLGRSRARAFALARSMTTDLEDARDLAVKRSRDAKAAELSSRAVAAMLQRTGSMAHVGGWELDLLNNKLSWSDEVYRIHDLPVGTAVTLDRAVAFYPQEVREEIREIVRAGIEQGRGWDVEMPLITAKDRQIWVRAQGECIREGDRVVRLCGAFQDITDRKVAEEALRLSATHDKLTGLPNRALLTDRLQQCLNRQMRRPERTFAVLFMDFDRFKLVNDTLGHEAGDELLKQIGSRLRAALRPTDSIGRIDVTSTVGRLGGDEFVVVLGDIAVPEDANVVADRLLNALAAPYAIAGHDVVSTASIGVVTGNSSYTRPDEMLRDADIAMYEAKTTGKGRYVVFDKAMHERVQRRVAIESDLRKAVDEQQLSIAYQAVVDLSTGRTVGAEALLRWDHPTRGIIGPAELIPIAEETGLIFPIGEWVIEAACLQLRQWQDTLGADAPPSISVNLSRKQLAMSDLPQKVESILSRTGLSPHCLCFDIAENAVMKDTFMAKRQLHTLRKIGVKIAMDDFGTGQSSLAMLHEFPIDVLKIDRTFVASLSQGREFAALVSAVVMLARNLGIGIVAEGIETAEQLVALQSLDCEMGQGHYFSRALAPELFIERAVKRPNWNPSLTDDVRLSA